MTGAVFKRPESVLVVVHTAGGDVLLLERVRPAGWWQSVTGSLREGESPAEAARRELAEETGLAAGGLRDLALQARFPIHPDWRHRYAPEVTENLEHAFALELPGRTRIRLEPGGHRAFAWLPAEDAPVRATSWTDRQALARALGLEDPA
ncbi:MAG: dihydroneopterin triphosphate diphosphatase [Gammaproteobacteria bacterium]